MKKVWEGMYLMSGNKGKGERVSGMNRKTTACCLTFAWLISRLRLLAEADYLAPHRRQPADTIHTWHKQSP